MAPKLKLAKTNIAKRSGTKRCAIKRRAAPNLSQRLRALLRGGRCLVLVRHANTDQPPPGGRDSSRKLTSKGRKQCALTRKFWFDDLDSSVFACSSKAGRCKDTLRLLLDDSCANIVEIQSVYNSPKGLDDMFSELGYAPLSKYFAQFTHADELFEQNASTIVAETLDTLHGSRAVAAKTIVLCGHAVYTNACALYCARHLGAPSKEISSLLQVNLKEVEGFIVSLRRNTVHVVHKHTRKR